MVLASTPARRRVFTDCRANLALLQAGREKATSAKNKAARVWNAIFSALDDWSGTDTEWLVWMPAHTSRHQINVATRSDGQLLSSLDWLANMAVDELAKHAANSCRVDATTRSKLQPAWANALFWRSRLGAVTHDAQNHYVDEVQPDGTVVATRDRDSIGRPSDAKAPAADKKPNLRSPLDEAWPAYPPFDEDAFRRGIMYAPFAMYGPVIPIAQSPSSPVQPTPAVADNTPLVAISETSHSIHRAALRASQQSFRDDHARGHQTTPSPSQSKRKISAAARKIQQPTLRQQPATHRKRKLPGVHCANITTPPAAVVQLDDPRISMDPTEAQRVASQLCESATKHVANNDAALIHQPHTLAVTAAASTEDDVVSSQKRDSWLAQLRPMATRGAAMNPGQGALNLARVPEGHPRAPRELRPGCSQPRAYAQSACNRRTSPSPSVAMPYSSGIRAVMSRLLYGSNRRIEHPLVSTAAHTTSASAGSLGDTQPEGAGSNPAATAHHPG